MRIIPRSFILLLSLLSCGGGDENGSSEPDNVPAGDYRIFVTSVSYNGDLQGSSIDGVEGANAKCRALATAQGLTRSYKALISTSTSSALSRFNFFSGSLYKVVGSSKVLVLEDITDLWNLGSAALASNIDVDETGTSFGTSSYEVWTGTLTDGTSDSDNCSNWTDDSVGDGAYGITKPATDNSELIFVNNNKNCAEGKRIYCVGN